VIRPHAGISVVALTGPAGGLVTQTAGCGAIAVYLDGALHYELNEIFSLITKSSEHRHDVLYPLGSPLEGLAFGAPDDPFGVVRPQGAKTIEIGVGSGIGEAGRRVANSRLVQQASE